MSSRGRVAVASAHPLSTAAGLGVLAAGGNSFDAALAVSATLPVVQPHMNGLGSDFFAIVRDGPSVAVNSSGPAANEATPELYRQRHWAAVPARGPLAAITVPGLVAAWPYLAERGHLTWARNLAPAVRWASRGFPATPSLARASRLASWGDRDFRRIYSEVRSGRTLRQPAIARTLRAIGEDAGHGFYHGSLARRICRDLREKGGLLAEEDFDGFRPRLSRPLRVRYRGYAVETNPPPSQGATELFWLNRLAAQDLTTVREREYLGRLVEAMYPAYALRARVIGDPDYLTFPTSLLRTVGGAPGGPRRGRISEGISDTTAFSVWDGSVAISAIQSNYMGFGSGISTSGAGINLNNRGCYFSLDPAHHNLLVPGKRTFHTLMATLATGPRTVMLGSMGGDVQPQVNVQVLTRLIDRGQSLTDAITAPRFAYPASIYGAARLYREAGVPLANARVRRHDRALFGHAQGIVVGEETEVGIDPRGDGRLPLPS